ncbi:MAG: IS3 family transposase [Rectinemataceae bacterium]
MTDQVISTFGLSERRACSLIGINRNSYRYEKKEVADDGLRDAIKRLAEKHSKYGYRMITLKLRQQQVLANHKRIERIYREEGLQLARKRKSRKTGSVIRNNPEPVTSLNEEWAMDFVSDTLHDGGRFRVFTLIDTHSRMALCLQARASMTGSMITQFLDQALVEYGKPRRIRCDNGPEFVGKALDQWCYQNEIELYFIKPGKPTENCYIESFNGTFRDECLSTNWFWSIYEAQIIIEKWQREYNEERPHGSLGGLTPWGFTLKLGAESTI